MADHLELVAEIPKVEKLTVQDRLQLARKRRSQQLKRWEREKDKELSPPPPKKKPQRARPVKFEPRIILLEAASRGDVEEVKKMLDYGVDPNLANDDGLTALHQACIDECDDIAELLVEYGAYIDAEDRELWTPLHASAACGNFSMVEYLVDHGASVVALNSDGNLPVDLLEDDEDLKDYLLKEMDKHGFDERKIDELVQLRERQMLEDIKDAIEKKRDLEIKNMEGATALHIASANAYEEVLEFLLDNDADVDVEDKDGWKPIHAAACWGNEKAIELLVKHGAELECRTPHGETPLDLCEDPDIRQFIIDLKGKIKTNKFKVKNTRRKRSNSRSLSVKRSSLKEKISISQNEAKAEAVLRQHPELAFLITNEKKTGNEEPKKIDTNVGNHKLNGEDKSSTPSRGQQEDKRPLGFDTMVVEVSSSRIHERSSEIIEKSENKVRDVRSAMAGGQNKPLADLTNSTKASQPTTRRQDVAAPLQGSVTTTGQSKSRITTEERLEQSKTTFKLSETITPLSCPPARSPTAGHRQLPKDPSLTKEITVNSQSIQGYTSRTEQRTSTAEPSSELGSKAKPTQPVTVPKSTKAHPAPPVPRPRSSGSTSAPVVLQSSGSTSGRNQASPSDTSGYPDSFNKRKSRDLREINEASLRQLAKDIKASTPVSPEDIKLSSQTVNAKQTKPQVPLHNSTNTPSTLEVSSEITPPKQTSDTNNINDAKTSSSQESKKRFTQPTDVVVEGQKNSCCILL